MTLEAATTPRSDRPEPRVEQVEAPESAERPVGGCDRCPRSFEVLIEDVLRSRE